MSTLSILPVKHPVDLLNIYPNETKPQGSFIELDLSSGRMSARYDPEIGNAVPMDVWHGIVRRYYLPGPLLAKAVNALMEDIAGHAQAILDHVEVVWDGSNNVVRVHERNCAEELSCVCPIAVAERAIEDATNDMSEEDYVQWAEAGDWYTDGVDEYVARVQAGEDIEAVANFMEQEINEDAEGLVVEGIHAYLTRAVVQAKAERERDEEDYERTMAAYDEAEKSDESPQAEGR